MALCDINGKVIAVSGDTAVLTHRIIENPNLADPSKFTVGVLDISTGAITAHGAYNTTDFIPVTPGQIMSGGFIQKYKHNPWFEATAWCEYCGYPQIMCCSRHQPLVLLQVAEAEAQYKSDPK